MKIAYMSDVHSEMDAFVMNFDLPDADVCVLAGDIAQLYHFNKGFWKLSTEHRSIDFIVKVCEKYPVVLWVPGNHEFYDSKLSEGAIVEEFKREYGIDNLHFFKCGSFQHEDVLFCCATMWTDFNKKDPIAFSNAGRRMNDYLLIYTDIGGSIWPDDTYKLHVRDAQFIREETLKPGKKVVVTHHAPLFIDEIRPLNTVTWCYYSTDLEDIIFDSSREIEAWIFGHVHDSRDTIISHDDGTDMILTTNCKGYPGESLGRDFRVKVIEV